MSSPDEWFFIAGCQRSGTTLMRLVLECHARIECWDESLAYAVIAGKRAPPARTRSLVGLKIPCLTEQLANPYLWDPYLLPQTPNVYNGQRIVFLMRDVRDTIASMNGLRPYGRSWLDTHMLPALRAKIARDAIFRRRYARDIERLGTSRHPRLARAAFYWRYKAQAVLDYLERGFPVLLLRYEDLVAQPQLELVRVCGFLQVPWDPDLLRHDALAHTQLNEHGLAMGDTDPRRAIDTRSIDRWHDAFDDDELDEIVRFAGDLQTVLYPSPAPRPERTPQ